MAPGKTLEFFAPTLASTPRAQETVGRGANVGIWPPTSKGHDGPARAMHCARALGDALTTLDVDIRAGIHSGEIELRHDDVGGIAVHIAARLVALAGSGDIVVSSTVKDFVVGSGIRFYDRGVHTLRGVPDQWRLFGAEPWVSAPMPSWRKGSLRGVSG